jgi:O-antigen/teichoic acid export membrane protein
MTKSISAGKDIKSNFVWNAALTASNIVFPLLTFPYLSRVLGVDGLGVCNFILSYCQNFIVIAALGVSIYGVREIARIGNDQVKRSNFFFELFIVHLSLTLIILIGYLISVFSSESLKNYQDFSLAGALLILSSAFSIEWLFSGVSDFKFIAVRSIVIKVASVCLILCLINNKEDVFLYYLIYIGQFLLTAILNMYYSRRFISRKVKLSASRVYSHLWSVFVLGGYIVLTKIYTLLPITLLGFLSTTTAVGYFYTADKIVGVFISFFGALSAVIIPRLNLLLEEKDVFGFNLLIEKSLSFVVSFGVPISVFVFLFARPLTLLIAGEAFSGSVICVQIMSPMILLVGLAQIYSIQVLCVHREDIKMLVLSSAGMVCSLFINLWLIPSFHHKATSIAQLCSELIVTSMAFWFVSRISRIEFPLKKFVYNLLYVFPFVLISLVAFSSSNNNLFVLILGGACCFVYFFCYQLLFLKDHFCISLFRQYRSRIGLNKIVSHG